MTVLLHTLPFNYSAPITIPITSDGFFQCYPIYHATQPPSFILSSEKWFVNNLLCDRIYLPVSNEVFIHVWLGQICFRIKCMEIRMNMQPTHTSEVHSITHLPAPVLFTHTHTSFTFLLILFFHPREEGSVSFSWRNIYPVNPQYILSNTAIYNINRSLQVTYGPGIAFQASIYDGI